MKNTIRISALIAAGLVMAGCSGASEAPATTPPPATVPAEAQYMPKETAPKPSEAQAKKLLADLGKIDPAFNRPITVERARAICDDILAGKSDAELATRVRAIFNGSAGQLSQPQSADVLKGIKASGFCKK